MTESKVSAIEIVGETCAKPQPKKKIVYAPDGKSMWYEEVKEKTKTNTRMKCTHPIGPCPFYGEGKDEEAAKHKVPEDCYDSEGEPCEWLE